MSQSSSQQAHIAVIDTAINDYQALVDAARIKGQAIILVSPGSSGLSQLADALGGYSDVASISIFSHGRAGLLELGSDQVTADNISLYEETLTQIGASLRDGADILLYGCEVGADEAGLALIERLSQLMGADVAASDDLTGNAELGGDWELEIRHGDIDASVQDGSVSLRGFNNLLASSYTINFDHSGATTNYDASSDNDAEIPVSNYTFVVDGERTGVKIYDYNAPFEYYATIGGNGDAYETKVTMKFDGGETFNITSLALHHYGDGEEVFTISSDKSDSKQVTQGEGGDGFETITLNWSNISELYITSNDKKMSVNIDNIELNSITSANTPPFVC